MFLDVGCFSFTKLLLDSLSKHGLFGLTGTWFLMAQWTTTTK